MPSRRARSGAAPPRRAAAAATERTRVNRLRATARPRGSARRCAALALGLVAMSLGQAARADDEGSVTTRVGSQVAGYTDSVGVSVLTPSASARVESPTAGWSAQGQYLVDFVSAASPDVVATASPRWTEVR